MMRYSVLNIVVFLSVALAFPLGIGALQAADAVESDSWEKASDFFSKERQNMRHDVVLYGHEFTLDSYLVSFYPRPQWSEVGYLVPEIFPGIEGKGDVRRPRSIVLTLSKMQQEYRDLVDKEIGFLAEKLEAQGHVNFIPGYDTETWTSYPRAGDPIVRPNSKERRVEYIVGGLHDLIDQNVLGKAIADYNEVLEEKGVSPLAPELFANVILFHKYAYAAFGLKVMVMASPQMQKHLQSQTANVDLKK